MEFTGSALNHEKVSEENDSKQTKNYESIARIEEEIDSAYTMIENKFASLWSSASRNAQDLQKQGNLEKHKNGLIDQISDIRKSLVSNESNSHNESLVQEKIDNIKQQVEEYKSKVDMSSLTSKANQALDSLDSKLEIVEQQAGKFVSLFASFFSNVVSVNASTNDLEPDNKPKMPHTAYGSNRFESDLFQLHTSEGPYLSSGYDVLADFESFNVDDRSAEISGLLQRYPDTLERTMNKLVPIQTSYKEFWYRYFVNEAKLKSNDQARKELLAAEQIHKRDERNGPIGDEQQEEDEEEFTWDDDDEEAAIKDSAT